MKPFQVSAPGRVCLFGEHQDYLGLPVIPSAINMRTTIKCYNLEEDSRSITIHATDLDKDYSFEIQEEYDLSDPDLSYFQAVLVVFKNHGYFDNLRGFECDVSSKIPIKSGLSSSAALLVAFVKAISTACEVQLTPQDIGWYAYEAEHNVMGIPCGMMDQLSSAIGGIIHLSCVEPPVITPLSAKLNGIVVADTKVHKSTSNVHSMRVRETKSGLDHLKEYVDFDLNTTPYVDIEPVLENLDEIERKRLIAVFNDRDITVKSLRLLQAKKLDYQAIGELLNEHQLYLREYFDVSIEKIDAIIDNAINHGAIGGKLTGAGLGGSIVILAPGKEQEVSAAIEESDGIPYIVQTDRGVM
ncbi:MAG TPA: galactokinase family protein [Candidatus Lokiarchaeia archaeon]|nr:galactokinase family protein [Candidatus Lokiarchaeia archaeon]